MPSATRPVRCGPRRKLGRMSCAASPDLHTARLHLCAPDPQQALAVADFYQRNAAHFAPWDPPQPHDHTSPGRVQQALIDAALAFREGRALRWWLRRSGQPERIIGSVHLSGVARGPFQNAMLGYALDRQAQHCGLMGEALQAAVAEAFSPRVNLHRLQAAVQPGNARSLAVLRRLGFHEEGLARDYLFVAGGWRDHRLFALVNRDFRPPENW